VADGVRVSKISQDWDSGMYINNYTSPKAMLDDLKLDGVLISEGKRYLQTFMPKSWERHESLMASLDTLDNSNVAETIQYKFELAQVNQRTGMCQLVIDGEVWHENMPEKVVIVSRNHVNGRGGGSTYYDLIIDAKCVIEEVNEQNPYSDADDSLVKRGFVQIEQEVGSFSRVWVKGSKVETTSNGNTPFAGLFGK
jgi:hypothetical protein